MAATKRKSGIVQRKDGHGWKRFSASAAEVIAQAFPQCRKSGVADIFIYPGHTFQAVTGLVTNFHLPKSSLLMLVCAFAGRDLTLNAYRYAVREGFRFYSYGDAMCIL